MTGLGVAIAVVFAAVFLVVPGVMMVRDEVVLRRRRREVGVRFPLDRGTLTFAAIMIVAGVTVIVSRVLS